MSKDWWGDDSGSSESNGGDWWGGDSKKAVRKKSGKSFGNRVAQTGKSGLLAALDILDRPVQAVKGVLDETHDHEGELSFAALKGDLKAGLEGLRGQRKTTSREALNVNLRGKPGAVFDFVGDVALDPTTYLSVGTKPAAKLGLKKASESLGKTVATDIVERGAKNVLDDTQRAALRKSLVEAEGGSEKAANRVLKALDKSGQGGVRFAGQTIVPGAKLAPITKPVAKLGALARDTKVADAVIPRTRIASRLGQGVADDVGAAAARARASAGNHLADVTAELHRVAKAARVTSSEIRDIVGPALERADVVVPDRLAPLVDTLRRVRDVATNRQVAAEVLPTARENYVPRFLTEEARDALDRQPALAEKLFASQPSQMRSATRQGGHLNERTFMPDAQLHDANRALKQALRLKGDAYLTDPIVATGRRVALAEQAVAQRKLVDDLARLTTADGEPILLRAGEGVARPAGYVEVDAGPLGKLYAPAEIADELEHVRAVVTNDKSIREFEGLMGKLNTLWKAYATVPLVGGAGFHLRNAQGNVWNNFLAGVTNPADYARAAGLQRALRKANGHLSELSAADRELVALAKKHGVLDEGFFVSDLVNPKSGGGRLGRVAVDKRGARLRNAVNPMSTDNAIIAPGRAVGSAIENNARLAHFIAKLHQLGNAEAAAASVRKYLFDYGDLTPFERTKLKKVVAFYTFMRKNTPLQIEAIGKQPGKFSGLAHSYAAAANASEDPGAPDWAVKAGMVPGPGGLLYGIETPFQSAVETVDPENIKKLGFTSGLVPSVLKALVENETKRSLFTGGYMADPEAQHLADAAMPLLGKIRRAPYGHKLPTGAGFALNDDSPDQALARLIAALTGLSVRKP